ncbi:MAG: hypothetical protein JWL77_771 [Chthonomonadaceae bacterium]|nr:hypothetical protein [Chthonomonadaceae bacterium]
MNEPANPSVPETSTQTGTAVAGDVGPSQHTIHTWTLWLIGFIILLAVGAAWFASRLRTNRAWRTFAARIQGEFRPRNMLSPDLLTGTIRGRGYMLETATSSEDDAPYYHTRASIPIKNSAGFVMGLRRKSMLEEAQSRNEASAIDLGDAEFSRRFFVVSNDPEAVAAVLTPEARRELNRYHDVEIYVRLGTMEWRRSGEVNALPCIERLTDLILDMGDTIDKLPARPRTLSERLADEALIQKGV